MKNAWKSPGLGATVLILLTVAAYLPAWHAGFVFDDFSLILENPLIKVGDGLHRFWFTTQAPDYYPLTWSLWWLEWRLWGEHPLGYHMVNVALHAANAVLVWSILKRLKIPGAWFAGLVFAVHPVNVATVAWISEQKNTLSMLFYLAAILLYLRSEEDGRGWWYGLSLGAFLLALLSKTAVVMLPVVLLGCVWWTRGEVRWKDVQRSGPFFLASLAMGFVTIWFQSHRAMQNLGSPATGFAFRLAAAGWAPWFYLYKALLPVNLTVVYARWSIDASQWVSYVPGATLMGALAIFWWRRKTWGRACLFGVGYFVVTLFPVLGFFDQALYRATLVADHWQYCAIVGIIALAVAAAQWIGRRIGEQGRNWGMAAGLAVILALEMATWERSGVYADDATLWRDNLARNPNAWLAHNNLGNALQRAGKLAEAKEQYEQALLLMPDYPEAENNLGTALGEAGEYEQAIGHFVRALRMVPTYAQAHYNFGNALVHLGRPTEALTQYQEALKIRPDYPEAQYNMGIALMQLGRVPEAIGHFEEALRIDPNDAEGHHDLGLALAQVGKYNEAMQHYEQALRIDPNYAEAHCDFGVALEQVGRREEAIAQYEQALSIRPDYAVAQSKLARLRALP